MGSEMFSIMCFKSDFLTGMNCMFWISTGFVKLISRWWVIWGQEKGFSSLGWGRYGCRGVFASGRVAHQWPSPSVARYLLNPPSKGVNMRKGNCCLKQSWCCLRWRSPGMVAAVTVCSGFPLQLQLGASPTRRAASCGCGEALLPLPAAGAGNKRRFHGARQTSRELSRGWMPVCLSGSFMLRQTWFCFMRCVEGIMKQKAKLLVRRQ